MVEEIGDIKRIGNEPVLSPKQVCKYLGIARSTLTHRINNDDTFPRSFKISDRKIYWKYVDIEDWVKKKMNGDSNVGIRSFSVR